MSALVGPFNQENPLVGAFSVIVKSSRRFIWSSSGQPPEDGHFAGIRPLQFALYSTLHQLRISNVRNDGNGGAILLLVNSTWLRYKGWATRTRINCELRKILLFYAKKHKYFLQRITEMQSIQKIFAGKLIHNYIYKLSSEQVTEYRPALDIRCPGSCIPAKFFPLISCLNKKSCCCSEIHGGLYPRYEI